MDPLNDPTALPELSFDDLLDESPIKRFPTRTLNDDVVDTNISLKDQTLNTPNGPKRKINLLTTNNKADQQSDDILTEGPTTSKISLTPTLKPIQKITTTLTTMPTTLKTIAAPTTVSAPIVLNNKLSLNPSGGNVPQTIVKIATATIGKPGIASPTVSATIPTTTAITAVKPPTVGTMTTIGGKTAIKTANGQIVYLQKAPIVNSVGSSTFRLSIGGNNPNATKTALSTSTAGIVAGNKTVAIQFVRSADGKLVPLKTQTNTTTTTAKPNLAVKKLLPTTSNQIVVKAASPGNVLTKTVPATSNVVTAPSTTAPKPFKIQKIMTPSASGLPKNPNTTILNAPSVSKPIPTAISLATTSNSTSTATTGSISSIAKPLTSSTTSAGGKVFVQSTTGKQIILPNSQLIKLSPKPTGTATVGGGSANTVTVVGNNSKVRAIQIPGKIGMQYVRVLPSTSSAPSSSSLQNSTSISETSTAAAAKLLNATPTKFSVVRSNSNGKYFLTQSPKVEGTVNSPGATNMSPSIVQKTIVTVPKLRTLTNQESLAATVGDGSPKKVTTKPMTVTLLRPKGKISEINTEIKRMTTANIAGAAGSVETGKKIISSADGTRFFLMPRTIQQQQQQLQQQLQSPKTIVKSGTLTTTSDGALKSFIICKPNQNDNNILKTLPVKKSTFEKPISSINMQSPQKTFLENKNFTTKTPTTIDITSNAKSSTNNSNDNNNSSNNNNNNNSKFIPIKIKEEVLDSDEVASDDPFTHGGVRRKHCNCSKSQCLKLYCDCFANGEFCQDCTCKDCFNSLQYEDERLRAIRSCLDRNPSAFKPKITSAADQGDARLHNKGCNCKRSGCLKNYCECFEAKIPCSSNCKCVGCRNVEDRPDLDMDPIDPKILETIANASNATNTIARAVSHQASGGGSFGAFGVKRAHEQFSESDTDNKRRRSNDGGIASLVSTQHSDDDEDTEGSDVKQTEKRSTNFITQEVMDATIQCMISQADECLKSNLPRHQIEKMIIEELGRCLVEIIDFSIRNTDNSFTQN